jgi:hypothetical protein
MYTREIAAVRGCSAKLGYHSNARTNLEKVVSGAEPRTRGPARALALNPINFARRSSYHLLGTLCARRTIPNRFWHEDDSPSRQTLTFRYWLHNEFKYK